MHDNWIGGIINLNWQGNLNAVQYTAFVLFGKGCIICEKIRNFNGEINQSKPMIEIKLSSIDSFISIRIIIAFYPMSCINT